MKRDKKSIQVLAKFATGRRNTPPKFKSKAAKATAYQTACFAKISLTDIVEDAKKGFLPKLDRSAFSLNSPPDLFAGR